VRWRDPAARWVLASGNIIIATGSDIRALDARSGRVRWRGPGRAAAVAAGRVYAQKRVLDLLTGEVRGTHPTVLTAIRLV
jgi:outer membrane protein assembly factor BamB